MYLTPRETSEGALHQSYMDVGRGWAEPTWLDPLYISDFVDFCTCFIVSYHTVFMDHGWFTTHCRARIVGANALSVGQKAKKAGGTRACM